jgi:hypothetical protein
MPPTDSSAQLAAFTVKQMATGTWGMIEADLAEEGVVDMTADFGPHLVERERCAYLRPMVVLADSPERAVASKEYMFPFVGVIQCPQSELLKRIGPTLVCTLLTEDQRLIDEAIGSVHIDRINIGPIPTNRLNWLQPHEGNLIDFLFRSRAYQSAPIAGRGS